MHGANGEDFGARGARRYVRRAVEASLRRLRTDHIDLYQLHRPDPVTPIEETLSVLTDLVGEGKVRYLGCSNFAAWQIADADWIARSGGLQRFVSVQNQYSLLSRDIEAEVVPAANRFGLGVLPFFPLEAGLLTGKYRRGEPPAAGTRFAVEAGRRQWLAEVDWDRVERLEAYAAERSLTLVDVAIAGLAAQPGVASVIAGATSAEQMRTNAAALDWRPSPAELMDLDRITHHPG
jgi:aryl-alcohol dehydrogenase-like predicted oxidoreductase